MTELRDRGSMELLLPAHHRGGWLIELELDGGYVRGTTWPWTVHWAGVVWTSAHRVLQVEQIDERTTGAATGVRLTLSPLPAGDDDVIELQAAALAAPWSRRPARAWWAGIDDRGQVIDGMLAKQGWLSEPSFQEDGETTTVSTSIESWSLETMRRSDYNYSAASQRDLYPADAFFDGAESFVEVEIPWPG
ncbi:MAG: hypothetical protein AAFX81_15950 [Pseudomonadota bacterium]